MSNPSRSRVSPIITQNSVSNDLAQLKIDLSLAISTEEQARQAAVLDNANALANVEANLPISLLPQELDSYPSLTNFTSSTANNGYLPLRNNQNKQVDGLVSVFTTGISDKWTIDYVNVPLSNGLVSNIENTLSCSEPFANNSIHNLMTSGKYSEFTFTCEFQVASPDNSVASVMWDLQPVASDTLGGASYNYRALDLTGYVRSSDEVFSTSNSIGSGWKSLSVSKVGTTITVIINEGTPIIDTTSNDTGYIGILANSNIEYRNIRIQSNTVSSGATLLPSSFTLSSNIGQLALDDISRFGEFVSMNKDGDKMLVTGMLADHTQKIYIYNLVNDKWELKQTINSRKLTTVKMSLDGTKIVALATYSNNKVTPPTPPGHTVYELQSGSFVSIHSVDYTLNGKAVSIDSNTYGSAHLDVSEDGSRFVTGGDWGPVVNGSFTKKGLIDVWEVNASSTNAADKYHIIKTWGGDDDDVSGYNPGHGCSISPDGTFVGFNGENNISWDNPKFFLFEENNGVWKETHTVPASSYSYFASIGFSPNGKYLVVAWHGTDVTWSDALPIVVFENTNGVWNKISSGSALDADVPIFGATTKITNTATIVASGKNYDVRVYYYNAIEEKYYALAGVDEGTVNSNSGMYYNNALDVSVVNSELTIMNGDIVKGTLKQYKTLLP